MTDAELSPAGDGKAANPIQFNRPLFWLRAGFLTAVGAVAVGLLTVVALHLAGTAFHVATPFIVAFVLAMLLDPLADRLIGRGFSRTAAVAVVFLGLLLVLVALGVLVVPALIEQASRLTQNGPEYVSTLRSTVDNWLHAHRRIGSYTLPASFDAIVSQISERTSATMSHSSGRLTGLVVGSVSRIVQLLVTLILTFYILLDVDRFRARFFFLLPERARRPVKEVSRQVGTVFSDYLRGLMTVCALYGTSTLLLLYALSVVHHELARFALLIGALAGVLYTVPYVGALLTLILTFIVGFAAGGAGFAALSAGCLLVLNQIFDNVISPRIVGGGVGLHPVAAIFALSLGAELFGIPGMILSVPVAASLWVVLVRIFPRFARPTPAYFMDATPTDEIVA